MNIRKVLNRMLTDTAVYFTLISAVYAALMMIVNVNEPEVLMSASQLLLIFVFSALAAISQCIYRISSINKALRVLIQYAILTVSFYVCFLLPLQSMSGSHVVVGITVFTAVYFICFGIGSFFAWRFKENTKKEEVYENKFKKSR